MISDDSGGAHAQRASLYRRCPPGRARTLSTRRRWAYRLAVPLILACTRFWWRSCRIVAVLGEQHLDAVLTQSRSFLPCYWHQHQLFCARYLLQQGRRRGLRIGFLISPSLDGELGAMLMRRLGAQVIRGSSTSTGALALKGYYEALTRDGVCPVITPDGPRGPRFRFKPGAILLAQLSGRPILPFAYAASRAVLVHWDRFVIPIPFLARIAVAIGPPLQVPRSLNAAGLALLQQRMESTLRQTYEAAHAALESGSAGIERSKLDLGQ